MSRFAWEGTGFDLDIEDVDRRVVAEDREETEPCEANTPGCCIDHGRSGRDVDCDTW